MTAGFRLTASSSYRDFSELIMYSPLLSIKTLVAGSLFLFISSGHHVLAQGEWGPWQPVEQGQWSQPIQGEWGPWQPVQPGNQDQLPGRTVYETVEKVVRVFNPATGQYEMQTVREVVPVRIGQPTPGFNRFLVTVINGMTGDVTFNIGNLSQRISPGQSWKVSAYHGQRYNYSGSPRQTGPGQWVGGGVFQGTISRNQQTITLGSNQGGVDPNSSFTITVINNLGSEVTFNIGNQSQKISPGQSRKFQASNGQEYGYSGAPRQIGPGQWVGGGTFRGTVSSNQRTITLGSNSDGNLPNNRFTVTVVNGLSSEVTFNVGNMSGQISPGGSWKVSAYDGQEYGYSRPPRQTGTGQWVGGGTARGTFSRNQRTITLGQSNQPPAPDAGPAKQFLATFDNKYNSSVRIVILDANKQEIGSMTLQSGQQFSVSVREDYSYIQEGPAVQRNGGAISGTKRGTFSSDKPFISLGG